MFAINSLISKMVYLFVIDKVNFVGCKFFNTCIQQITYYLLVYYLPLVRKIVAVFPKLPSCLSTNTVALNNSFTGTAKTIEKLLQKLWSKKRSADGFML